MRLLISTQYFWPETFIINDVAKLLNARGVGVSVLTGKPNYPSGDIAQGYRAGGRQIEVYEGCDVLRVPMAPRGKSRVKLTLNYLSFILSGMVFGPSMLKDRQFDAVLVYGISPLLQALPAIYIARRFKVPVIVWVQDLWPESLIATGFFKDGFVVSAISKLVRFIYKKSDLILTQSEAFKPAVREFCDDPAKVAYLPNFYVMDDQKKGAAPSSLPNTGFGDGFNLVFAGNLGQAQGLETIVDAATLLRERADIRFVIVGSGRMEAWLGEECDRRGLDNVHLIGRVPPEAIPDILAQAQAALISLRKDPALAVTVPSKLQAYLAAGCPIIASLDGEPARIVESSGAGFCATAGDAKALSEIIVRMADIPVADRQEMATCGKKYFEGHFAPDLVIEELIDHVKKVVETNGTKK